MSNTKPTSEENESAGHEPKASRPYMPGYGIKAPDEAEGLLPWSWAVERLTISHGFWLSTVRIDGRPHCMPVWGVWINNRFLFSTGAQSRKAQNISANPKCVVSTDRVDQAVVVEGAVREAAEPTLIREFCRAYQEKYKWDMSDFKEPVFAVSPSTVFAITESAGEYSFTGSATRWKFSGA